MLIKTLLPLLLAILFAPLKLLAAETDGESLYQTHCSACHQTEGYGGIGLPLSPQKIGIVSDDYLSKTIQLGRPGRLMPPFAEELETAEIEAIVAYLRSRSDQPPPVETGERIAGDAGAGKLLFQQNCVRCHGADGSGLGTGTGVTMTREREFPIMPAALNNPGFQASASDRMIRDSILNGRPGSIMPPFKDSALTSADIDNLVAYIRTLSPTDVKHDSDSVYSEAAVYVVESPYDFDTTVKNIKQALGGANFRIFPERYLEQGLTDDANVNKRQLGIRFCNFSNLYDLLKTEPRVGIGLPCRITVMETENGVIMVAPNLRYMSDWFNNDELTVTAGQMDQTIRDIIEEASL